MSVCDVVSIVGREQFSVRHSHGDGTTKGLLNGPFGRVERKGRYFDGKRKRPEGINLFSVVGHHDHAGGLCQFDIRIGHSAEAKIFAEPSRKTIVADLLDASVIRKSPYEGFDVSTWCYQPAPLTGQVDDGDAIDLGDRYFHIVHVPGHSPGSVAIFEPKTGIILTGDAIYDGVLYDHLFHSVPDHLVHSLHKMLSLDFSVVHAGHFDSFDRARAEIITREYLDGKRSMLCPAT